MAVTRRRRRGRAQKVIIDFSPGPADAEFWDRAPKAIHRDPRLPEELPHNVFTARNWNWTPQQQATIDQMFADPAPAFCAAHKTRLAQVTHALSGLAEHERALLSHLTARVFQAYPPPFSSPVRRRLAHIAVMQALARDGPEQAFSDPAVRGYLDGLWKSARSAPTMEERKAAREAWGAIFGVAMPDLRRFKETPAASVDGAALAAAVDRTRTFVRGVKDREWESPAPVVKELRALFPGLPMLPIRHLAEAIAERDADGIRTGIYGVAGAPFGLAHTGVRDALARYRRDLERRRLAKRIAAGQARYLSWLAKRERKKGSPSRPGAPRGKVSR